jgi:hypothetical protein
MNRIPQPDDAAARVRAGRERDVQARAAAFAALYPDGPWTTPLRAWEFALPGERERRPARRKRSR